MSFEIIDFKLWNYYLCSVKQTITDILFTYFEHTYLFAAKNQ